MAMPSRSLVPEIARFNSIAPGHQRHTVRRADFAPAHCLMAAVPNAEDDAPLRRAVHLHAEITAMPSARHIICPDRVFHRSDLTIKRLHVGSHRNRVHQMHRRSISPLLQIEMGAHGGRAIQQQRLQVTSRLSRAVEGF